MTSMIKCFAQYLSVSFVVILGIYDSCNYLTKNCEMYSVYHPTSCIHSTTKSHEPRYGRRQDQRIDRLALIKVLE